MAEFIDILFNLSNNNLNNVVFGSFGSGMSIVFKNATNADDFMKLFNASANSRIITLANHTITTDLAVIELIDPTTLNIPITSGIIPGTINSIINRLDRNFNHPLLFGLGGSLASIAITNMGFASNGSVLNNFFNNPNYIISIMLRPDFEAQTGNPGIGILGAEMQPRTLVCLLKGTKILTPTGETLIENLHINDTVLTADGREVKIMDIHSTLASSENNLYVIYKDKVSQGVPNKDLFVSGGHLVKIHDKFYHPAHDKTDLIQKCNETKLVQFYHIKLENYLTDFLVANGLEVESLGDTENPEHTNWDCSGDDCKLLYREVPKLSSP